MIALLLAATFTRPLERVNTMDPAFSQTIYDARAVKLVYETPLEVDYRARPYRLSEGACEMPEVSEDGLVYRFKMRSREVSAGDVARSLERLRDKETVSPNAWMLDAVDTISADGDTVEIRLGKRCHYLPWLMAMAPAAIAKADGTGTGEYELKKWRKNHEMVFERKKPVPGGFDTIRYLVVDDVSTQWLMFLKGEIDFLGEIPRDNWDAAMTADGALAPGLAAQGIELHTIPTLETIYVGFNMKDPVVGENRALRQALNAAFDFPAWEKYYRGRVLAADGPVPPGVAGKLDAPFEYSFDLEKAKKLLAEAGYRDGIDPKTGRRLVLTLSMGRAGQDGRESGELMAAFYEKIGIKLELEFYTWDAFVRAVNEGRTQMYRIGWVGDYPDAQNFLQLFHSRNLPPGPNHSAYSNGEFDREYDLALETGDETQRDAHWRRCQEIVREDCPWIFANFNLASSLVRPRVGNYVASDFPYGQERYFEAREEK